MRQFSLVQDIAEDLRSIMSPGLDESDAPLLDRQDKTISRLIGQLSTLGEQTRAALRKIRARLKLRQPAAKIVGCLKHQETEGVLGGEMAEFRKLIIRGRLYSNQEEVDAEVANCHRKVSALLGSLEDLFDNFLGTPSDRKAQRAFEEGELPVFLPPNSLFAVENESHAVGGSLDTT